MRLSISSVVTTNLLITLLAALFCLAARQKRVICSLGIRAGIVFLVCLMLRALFPVEFFYTKSFYFQHFFTVIRKVLTMELAVGTARIGLYQVLLAVWAAGALLIGARKLRFFRRVERAARLGSEMLSQDKREYLAYMKADYPELEQTEILMFPGAPGPMLMGGREKKILMPEMDYSEEELRYIFAHEALHIRQKDVVWKLLIDFITTVYWWNPIFHILQETLFDMIEMNIDALLTRDSDAERKKAYMECLERVAESSEGVDCVGAICFSSSTAEHLRRRFYYIVHGKKESRIKKVVSYSVIAAVLFFSSCVVFEPVFPAPEGVFECTDENTYVIYRDGRYDIYLEGEYLITEDSLEHYSKVHNIIYEEGTGK